MERYRPAEGVIKTHEKDTKARDYTSLQELNYRCSKSKKQHSSESFSRMSINDKES